MNIKTLFIKRSGGKFLAAFAVVAVAGIVFAPMALADTLWATSTSNSIYNTNSGNVGIGTTGPVSKLHVSGGRTLLEPTAEQYALGLTRTDLNNKFWLGVVNGGSATADLVFSNSPGTELMRIKYNGNVGIGTTSPQTTLSIAGNGSGSFINGSPAQLLLNAANDTPFSLILHRDDLGSLSDSGIYNSGSVDGSSGGGFEFTTGNGIGGLATPLSLDKNGAYISGNVGIGTTTPASKLEVAGSIKLSGNIVSDGDICIGTCP